ncbi:hypothetical protein SAMN05444157_0070 [Frankineae bacterium MT45]|nr:hypothetical protein SAMN05444157_0070 [Frankineae bacterium MT45]
MYTHATRPNGKPSWTLRRLGLLSLVAGLGVGDLLVLASSGPSGGVVTQPVAARSARQAATAPASTSPSASPTANVLLPFSASTAPFTPALPAPSPAPSVMAPRPAAAAAQPATAVLPAVLPEIAPTAKQAAKPAAKPVVKKAVKPAVKKPTVKKPVKKVVKPVKKAVKKPVARKPAVPAYTSWPALNAAIARIPNLHPQWVHFIVADKGAWGATNLSTGTVYIAPRAPVADLYSIVVHEYAHVIQGRLYGNMAGAIAGLRPQFGNAGERTIEYAADCVARLEGATWTDYTSCTNPAWRRAAQALLNLRRP